MFIKISKKLISSGVLIYASSVGMVQKLLSGCVYLASESKQTVVAWDNNEQIGFFEWSIKIDIFLGKKCKISQ